jgi:hypothetical protein
MKKSRHAPNLLDIVRVNNRWAQVILDGRSIKYLDDNSLERIEWIDYLKVREYRPSSVLFLKFDGHEQFTDSEIENIHWGPEQNEHPYLKQLVKVFAEYVKK